MALFSAQVTPGLLRTTVRRRAFVDRQKDSISLPQSSLFMIRSPGEAFNPSRATLTVRNRIKQILYLKMLPPYYCLLFPWSGLHQPPSCTDSFAGWIHTASQHTTFLSFLATRYICWTTGDALIANSEALHQLRSTSPRR